MSKNAGNNLMVDNQHALRDLYGEHVSAELRECISSDASCCKRYLQSKQEQLNRHFSRGIQANVLVKGRALLIDNFLRELALIQSWDTSQKVCIIAVGGYGRGELHPYSDIDLLILLEKQPNSKNKEVIEGFITYLWDCGLDIGHSVRVVNDCVSLAKEDITVLTNLIESRYLLGDEILFNEVKAKTGQDKMWTSAEFFKAKWQEQRERHRRVDNNEYNLEPNIKTSPGGLRDIQTILWITKRHFKEQDILQLAARGVLTDIEAASFVEGMDFLCKARYALHITAGRHEDRLLFEHQVKVASLFGFSNDNANLAVEKFMHEYYRRVLLLAEINDVLMQQFDLDIVGNDESEEVIELNERFCVRNGYIDVVDESVFSQDLSALMEIFPLMAEQNYIRGVRASTIRLMRTYRENIDDDFRQNPKVIGLFNRLLRSGRHVPLQLKRMRQYGILSKYLPAFGNIIGQMQYDLFHIYTVDIHTLEVVDNIYRFAHEGSEFDYILAAKIINGHIKIELLYLAALFHDIAKGRGGDHSELGAHDARVFCEQHGFHDYETNLIVWLVENHLLMSSISQKQDLSDPDVIRQFAEQVADRNRLDYLFVLTVADINGTNPEMWNAWRASLMRQLYAGTTRALRRGLERAVDKQQIISVKQNNVLAKLESLDVNIDKVKRQWQNRVDEYFLRESTEDLILHAQAILESEDSDSPIIIIKPSSEFGNEVITQITIYCKLIENRFSFITLALEQLNLSIHDAQLLIAGGGHVLDTFYVLDADNESIDHNSNRIHLIREKLESILGSPDDRCLSSGRSLSRRLRSFSWPSQTVFSNDYAPGFSVLEVIAPDRPGLLTVVGQVFFDHALRLHSAKISTLGERVEDVFFLTDRQDNIIEDLDKIEKIQEDLRRALDENTHQ